MERTSQQRTDRMRRTSLLFCLALLVSARAVAQSDIENVIVETYYISNADDASDTNGGGLTEGSTTYRVYLDLCDSCALRSIYGDVNHTLRISSTTFFFNHLDRGPTYGHLINNGALDEGTASVDSWLSLGAGSNQKAGILKVDDPDGTILANNDGGSAGISGGLMQNTDAGAGIPLNLQDGLAPPVGSPVPPGFSVTGLLPDSTFFKLTQANEFISNDTRIACITPGVQGPTTDNRVLVAQLTTTGDLTFELNVEIEHPDGSVQKYVANDSVVLADEAPNGLLVYPPECGCTDPNFLEFDPTAGCDDGSCATTIIFGCLDTLACNYDPNANFNIAQLCCYGPDSCEGLDITIVCPGVGVEELRQAAPIELYPNPAANVLHVRGLNAWSNGSNVQASIHDAFGRLVLQTNMSATSGYELDLPVHDLAPGAYLLRISSPKATLTRSFIRE